MKVGDLILPAELKERYQALCMFYKVAGLKGLQSIKPQVEKKIAEWKRRKQLYHNVRNDSPLDDDNEMWNAAAKMYKEAEAQYWIYRSQLDTIEDFEEWYKTHRMAQDV